MKVLIIIFALLFIPMKIQAEPSPTVRQLMQDSFTMFDWGLYQLENFLKSMNLMISAWLERIWINMVFLARKIHKQAQFLRKLITSGIVIG